MTTEQYLESIRKDVRSLIDDIHAEQLKIEPTHFLNSLAGRIGYVLMGVEKMAESIANEAKRDERKLKELQDRLAYKLEQAKEARVEASRLPGDYHRHINDIAVHAKALVEAIYQAPYTDISEVVQDYVDTYY